MAIFWTLGSFLKPLATINWPKYPTFLGKFCKGVKIFNFSSEIHFWATFIDIRRFLSGHTGRNQINSEYQIAPFSHSLSRTRTTGRQLDAV